MDRKIFGVLLFSLIARIVYLFQSNEIWWDGAVYLSMAKYLVSLGSLGFWEPIRPLLWPFILSYSYLLGIDPVIWGHIWTTVFSLGIIYMTYVIGTKLFNPKIAFMSSILLSFTWIFFLFNVRLYTEIPSVFFALVAYNYYLKGRSIETGLFVGLSFLTKFPQGILLVVFGFLLLHNAKKLAGFLLGFICVAFPFLTFNIILYGSPIGNLIFASEFVKHAGIWIFQEPWTYYFIEVVKQNILFLFAVPGAIFALKKKRYSILLITVLFLLYFTQMPHKEIRFAILFLPYLSILAAYGYTKLFNNTTSFVVIVLLIFAITAIPSMANNNPYFAYFEGKEIGGEVLITHPLSGYYLDNEATKMYYPWFNSSQATHWLEYIEKNNPEYVSLDTCEGGFICPPNDLTCEDKRTSLINYLEENYNKEYSDQRSQCFYGVYSSRISTNSL